MHIIKLNITPLSSSPDTLFEYTNYYLQLLYENNQITNGEFQFESIENGVAVNLYCPEKTAYQDKNATQYAIAAKKRILDELEVSFTYEYIGIDPELGKTIIPKQSSFYILRDTQDYFWSPVICGDTYAQIPLYKIPYTTDHKSHSDIKFWRYDYSSIKGLWLTDYNNRWTVKQLQDHKSPLNQKGMACCRQLEAVTNIPSYYFLWNDRTGGVEKDKARKCPNCGNDWFIPNSDLGNLCAFKCDNCRLVSNLSSNY